MNEQQIEMWAEKFHKARQKENREEMLSISNQLASLGVPEETFLEIVATAMVKDAKIEGRELEKATVLSVIRVEAKIARIRYFLYKMRWFIVAVLASITIRMIW